MVVSALEAAGVPASAAEEDAEEVEGEVVEEEVVPLSVLRGWTHSYLQLPTWT